MEECPSFPGIARKDESPRRVFLGRVDFLTGPEDRCPEHGGPERGRGSRGPDGLDVSRPGIERPGIRRPGGGVPERPQPVGKPPPRARIMELPVTASPPHLKYPRLQRRAEFLRVAGRGRKLATPGLVLQVLRRDDAEPARLGFTVTKKVGNAVIRNRTRRRLKEAARLVLAEQPVPAPISC